MADYSRFNDLIISVENRVATLTLNRPQALNAVTAAMHFELARAFQELGSDPAVAAIIVTGAGRGFCSGADVKEVSTGRSPSGSAPSASEVAEDPFPRVIGVTRAMLGVPQPIIAAVNGAAVGQGATIALFCDVVIASERARFGDVHIKVGAVPHDGGVVIWPLLVGLNKAKELLLTGDIIDAREAYRIGLVQRLVPHERLMEEAKALATRLANGPLRAIRLTKQALNRVAWERADRGLEYTVLAELVGGRRQEAQEGAAAFAEKRDPRFGPTPE